MPTMERNRGADPLRGCEPAGPQILQLRPDRRLGHEWDDWDGNPVPNDGIYHEPPSVFFGLIAAWVGAWALAAALVLWVASPRLAQIGAALPGTLWILLATVVGAASLWLAAVWVSVRIGRNLLPAGLVERGPLPWVMPKAERAGKWFGLSRDRAGNAAVRVYNAVAAARARPGALRPDQLLVLLPRCLDKASMQGAMEVSSRYGVPLFVAARGRYAREMIRKVRPRAVVAVACERDLVSGIHDVAANLPVLGVTIGLPDGPCKNTTVTVTALEDQIRTFLGIDAAAR